MGEKEEKDKDGEEENGDDVHLAQPRVLMMMRRRRISWPLLNAMFDNNIGCKRFNNGYFAIV